MIRDDQKRRGDNTELAGKTATWWHDNRNTRHDLYLGRELFRATMMPLIENCGVERISLTLFFWGNARFLGA